jgi:hypothetical protein
MGWARPLVCNSAGVMNVRVLARAAQNRYRPHGAALTWLTVGLLTLITIAGCRRGVPVLDTGARPADAQGTITGTVRGPDSASSIDGRVVEVVNVETNERQRATTNTAGGFTFKVKPGNYRIELPLRNGESLVRAPGVMHVNRTDIDAHADFIIGAGRVSRPRGPAYRTDHGLGSPVA